MRQIKFRAWDKSTKEMLCIGTDVFDLMEGLDREYWKENAAMMQFTGLLDAKGREIYEGDIVEYDKDFQGKPFYGKRYRFEIGFSCGSFLVLDPEDKSGERGGFSGFYLHTPCLKIIGDIYQNPNYLNHEPKTDSLVGSKTMGLASRK